MIRIVRFILLMAIAAAPLCSRAQYFKKGTLAVSGGWSFLSVTANKMTAKKAVTNPQKGREFEGTTISPLFVSLNYGLSNSLSVGGTAGIMFAKSYTGLGTDSSASALYNRDYYYAYKGTYTIVTGRADWHWLTSDDGEQYSMDFYSGASLGVYMSNAKMYFIDNPTSISINDTHRKLNAPKVGVAWHINALGYKQKIGKRDRLCAYGEIGWGCWGLFKAALVYTIRK